MTNLAIDIIRKDGGTQPRASVHEEWITEYADDMQAGAKFPPVTVFFDGSDYWLADGFHRTAAAREAGRAEIEADIRQGDRRDAVLFSVSANGQHGHRRTTEDKRRAVDVLLSDPEWSKWSDRQIARQCDVSHEMVSTRRRSICQNLTDTQARLVTRNGITFEMQTGDIGRRAGVDVEVPDQSVEYTSPGITAVHNHRAQGTGENEWYTPAQYVEAAGVADAIEELSPCRGEELVARGPAEILRVASRIRAEQAKAEKVERAQRIAEAAASVPAASERYKLVHGPLTELLNHPAKSVDFIITDPPYPREFLPVFDQLGEVAKHLLKPGGLLLCMSGQTHLPEVYAQLNQHLDYYWTIAYLTPGGQATQIFPRRVNTFWKPVLVFSKCMYPGDWFGDVTRSDTNASDKRHHHWGQSESGMADLMRRFVRPGHVVVDPFLGGGTTAVVALELGASFVGCDVDEEAINATKARLAGVELAA